MPVMTVVPPWPVSNSTGPEPVTAPSAHNGHFRRRMSPPCGRVLLQCPVRPMAIVMIDVLAQDQPQVPFAGDQHPVQALAAALAIQRSAIAFARGARTGVLMIRTAAEVNTASNAAVNLVSRSLTKNLRPSS